MLKEERHLKILNEVALHNRVLLTDIAESLHVSIDTVRRDVKELDALNKLKKVHGGAIALGALACLSGDAVTRAEGRKWATKALEIACEYNADTAPPFHIVIKE